MTLSDLELKAIKDRSYEDWSEFSDYARSDISQLIEHIKSLEENLKLLTDDRDKLRKLIYFVVDELQMNIEDQSKILKKIWDLNADKTLGYYKED